MVEFKKYSNTKEKVKLERQTLDFKKDYLDKYCDELPIEWVKEGIPIDEIKRYRTKLRHFTNLLLNSSRKTELVMR